MNKYFFLHIPKTAGTSLFTFFRNILGEEQVYQVRDVNIGKQRAEAIRSFAMVGGHLTYDQMQTYFEQERYRLTFLRQPLERFLSMYYFYRQTEEVQRDLSVKMAKSMDLATYINWLLDSEEYKHLRNVQTWYLTGGLTTKRSTSLAERLDLAKENLTSLDFVGITEDMSDSLDFLSLDCCWPLVERIPRNNVTASRPKIEEIDGQLVQRIQEISSLDMELYSYGLKLYKQKKRQLLGECIERRRWELQANTEKTIQIHPSVQQLERKENTRDCNLKEGDTGSREVEILAVDVSGTETYYSRISSGETALIRIIMYSYIDEMNLIVGICIKDDYGQIVFGTNSYHLAHHISVHQGQVICVIFSQKMDLGEGHYHLTVALHTGENLGETVYHWKERACSFYISGFKRTFFEGITGLYPKISYESADLSLPLPMEMSSGVSIKIEKVVSEILCNTRFTALVSVTNESVYNLASFPPNPVYLSYHWYSVSGGESVVFEGDRSLLLRPLSAQSTDTYGLNVHSPHSIGEYVLRITLVQEMVFWFDQFPGHMFAECRVKVTG
ncbi:Sulfotransferase family [Desulfosporosinus acidiphilus SJ4]|uniref:Sulfotransferase family n=1 Tax=Desulfosporosinus acidiphilus (strain DSM 22704 / JCM 16185 / SJ4) TaxID=646529 RepID=I4DBS6_DESAJ|nr:Wzt carbohydrate-binding domain-containing protein [Desulfosporosinus acidiphilus]AFM43250.1 Sulfotransferase family [Desulfosporosinus acidiphilus SJ4]